MSNSIRISPKYGLNPTIPVCFWCGKERGEIALMGHMGCGNQDLEAPMHMAIDFEPCEECKEKMSMGFTVIESTSHPNVMCNTEIQPGVYPTGMFAVLKAEVAHKIFKGIEPDTQKAFLDSKTFKLMFGEVV